MSTTFWVNKSQLDDEQSHAVENVEESASFLLRGPAGSGKTNILLLRCKWLALKALPDFKIIVFTGSLKVFLEAGCNHYGLNPSSVTTAMAFFKSILVEYGVPFESTKNFESDRSVLAGMVMSLIDSHNISNKYCGALLVDEAQDYTDTELMVFRRLTSRLILAADSRQSIYKVTHSPGRLEQLVECVTLYMLCRESAAKMSRLVNRRKTINSVSV